MEKRLQYAQLALTVVAIVAVIVFGLAPRAAQQFKQQSISDWTTNFTAIQVDVPTIQPTNYPGLNVEMKGLGNSFELRNASSTPIFQVSAAGAVTAAGSVACSYSNLIVTGATAATTATPAFLVNNAADANELVSIQKDAAAVFTIGNSGAISRSGADTLTGSLIQTGHQIVTGPTAATTGTPVVLINAASDVNELLVVMKDAAAVFTIGNTGAITRSGADTLTGSLIQTGHQIVTGPTAATTGTPVIHVDNAADVNDLFVLDKDATPVFRVGNSGAVTGLVLQYSTAAGQKMVCGSTNITGTGEIAHALATPSYVQLSLAQNVTGDCAHLSYTNSAAVVTAKCWDTALTPAAAAAVAIVNWCVIGTP